ncbi:MAG: BspA family leucine-rich repeat surface protein, partial [Oscillospiraceae bacterium]|nr:BspA family leucine-rich repeat surface protein [Oscillospiraceae bacterium]
MGKKRILSFAAALAVLSMSAVPAFAEDTAEISAETVIIGEAAEVTEETSESVDTDEASAGEEDTQSEFPAESEVTDTEPMLETAENVQYADDWYSWDASTGTLTLKGQMPETSWDSIYGQAHGVAYYAGVEMSRIKKIVVEPGTKILGASYMFYGLENLTEIQGLDNLDTIRCHNMKFMFGFCSSLTKLDLSSFDTSNVTNMTEMFYYCSSLETVTVSDKWTTDGVVSSEDMFRNCSFLTGEKGTLYSSSHKDKEYARIDGGTSSPGYFTSAVVPDWFEWTASSGTLILQNQLPDTSSSNSLAKIAGIDPSAVKRVFVTPGTKTGTSAYYMFYNFVNLTDIQGLNNLDTSACTDMTGMFSGCNALSSLDVSSFDTSNVTTMASLFQNCESLTEIDLKNFNTSSVTSMTLMFSGCSGLTELDLQSFDTSKVKGVALMFSYCTSLTTIKVSDKWSTASVDMSNTFAAALLRGGVFTGCTNLKGGAGTVYDVNNVELRNDVTYAHIDGGASNPGYLTAANAAPEKPTVVIKTAFGGKTVQFNCSDPDAEIYYQTSSSNITLESDHVPAGTTVFFDKPMSWWAACIYFKAYKDGKWSKDGKWLLLNVDLAKPIITQSGKESE